MTDQYKCQACFERQLACLPSVSTTTAIAVRYTALQGVRQADMDLTGWLEFFVAGLSTQLQEVKTRGEQAIRADVLAVNKKLNPRQATLVTAFIERAQLTLADCERLFHDVALVPSSAI